MAHTHPDRGVSATAIILGLVVAGVAALLIAVFAFGAFGWNDGRGALEGGGGVDEAVPGNGQNGNGSEDPVNCLPPRTEGCPRPQGSHGGTGNSTIWHAAYGALTFV
jgi:hypothetical protein